MIVAVRRAVLLAALACTPVRGAFAQASGFPLVRTVRGIVRAPDSRPVEGANVFIIETLEGVVTREDGRFAIPVAVPGSVTLVTRAPFDVTHTLTTVAERAVVGGLRALVAYRYATGRPFTPVFGSEYDPSHRVFVPEYGAPMSERLPAFRRVDLSASYFRQVTPSLQTVLFASIMNIFDRDNAQSVRYTADYSRREMVPSLFERSVYFGGTITWLKENR